MTALSFEAIQKSDLDAVVRLSQSVSWPHRSDDIAMLIDLGDGYVYRGVEGEIQAVGQWWTYEDRVSRIGMIIVDPNRQGQGIGRKLVDRMLATLAPKPIKLLATEAGAPLYRSLGFKDVGKSHQHQGQTSVSKTVRSDIRLATGQDLPDIVALDQKANGFHRTDVLKSLVRIGEAVVMEGGDGLSGYAVRRPFGHGSVIGPIVGAQEEDAIALFDALVDPGFIRVDCDAASAVFRRHLERAGLPAIDSGSSEMVLGTWPKPVGEANVLAMASHALG